MGSKRRYIYLAIFLITVLPLNSAVDCFNDISEVDFLCDGRKFEDVDSTDFIAEKSCSSGMMIRANMFFSEFGILVSSLPASPTFLPISPSALTLRC
jgi:1,4-dihydroxy-2-naphthoate octaprenyltransferase